MRTPLLEQTYCNNFSLVITTISFNIARNYSSTRTAYELLNRKLYLSRSMQCLAPKVKFQIVNGSQTVI